MNHPVQIECGYAQGPDSRSGMWTCSDGCCGDAATLRPLKIKQNKTKPTLQFTRKQRKCYFCGGLDFQLPDSKKAVNFTYLLNYSPCKLLSSSV